MTGASSFTGFWFARALAEDGHQVQCTLQRASGEYVRHPLSERVRKLREFADVVESTSFGDDRFLDLVGRGPDIVAHHGSHVGDYRSADFDVVGAVAANTRNVRAVMERMKTCGSRAFVLTGTVFEPGEGVGTDQGCAFSSYGLSKGITSDIFRWHAREFGVPLAKFVIPNPFGPLEEERFCRYAYCRWLVGEPAVVRFPEYVRDNIHVDLLAMAYARYVSEAYDGTAVETLGPSGYVETQGAFALRLAREVGGRLGLKSEVTLASQADFDEPLVRVNTVPARHYVDTWVEDRSWECVVAWVDSIRLDYR